LIERVDVPVQGGSLAAYRIGTTTPNAPVALAIHGVTSTSRAWLAVARELGDRAALIAVDLRGRGRSNELPAPFGMQPHARDMFAVLDHVGIERAVIAGHSLGAYIAAAMALSQPHRISSLVLVDGGLTIPGSANVDMEAFIEEFLGPTFERLKMTFADQQGYRDWWARHPAFANSDVDRELLDQYADYDLVGTPPNLHSSIEPECVRVDGVDLFTVDSQALEVPAVLLCAPRGMVDDPNPMQPFELVRSWAAADLERRRAVQVPDVNHYTISFGAAGARVVAGEIVAALGRGPDTPPQR
jgi:pimeloyl-ACP methyl ester carboxylesterase